MILEMKVAIIFPAPHHLSAPPLMPAPAPSPTANSLSLPLIFRDASGDESYEPENDDGAVDGIGSSLSRPSPSPSSSRLHRPLRQRVKSKPSQPSSAVPDGYGLIETDSDEESSKPTTKGSKPLRPVLSGDGYTQETLDDTEEDKLKSHQSIAVRPPSFESPDILPIFALAHDLLPSSFPLNISL